MSVPPSQQKPEYFAPPNKVSIRELHVPNKRNFWIIKRGFDLFVSVVMLLVLSPLLLLLTLAIVIDDPKGGPFYSQVRCGRGGRLFKMYKFRSMHVNAEQMLDSLLDQNEMKGPVFKIKKDPRITRVGRIIRATSLDELPQLINILKGDMSLVGPRPPIPREVAQYDEYQFQRLYVTPGLTCTWQIAPHRNSISFDQWVRMDIDYVINRSILLDVKILFGTVLAVLRRSGE